MLSDEEKGAIEVLQYVKNKTPFIFLYEDKPYNRKETINTILNLFEKQSKEIEELKENNKKLTDEYLIQRDLINPDFLKDYISKEEAEQKEKKAYIDGTNVAHELCNKMWKNKIKAKIEELDYNDIGNFERRCKQEVLQSLLEKE